jgi:DNA-binding MarR family transcriptional regulator
MNRNRQARAPRAGAAGRSGRAEQVLDLDRYVPALITFIANKLSRSATVVYQKRFGVNVTEWRILSLLAIEPEISAARICHVIGFDKGPVSRTLAGMEERGLVSIRADRQDGRTHSISLTAKGLTTHDQVIAVALERERRLLSCLNKPERETLIGLLLRVHGNLDAVKARAKSTIAIERSAPAAAPTRALRRLAS